MALATVDADGAPDARMVLLKGFGPDGFRFFTNLGSAKAAPARGHAARGAHPLLAGARPAGEDRGAASRSCPRRRRRVLLNPAAGGADRRVGLAPEPAARRSRELDARVDEAGDGSPARRSRGPTHWGGFLVRPERIEFWQGQAARLHDRFVYTRAADGWEIQRLAP